MSETPRIRTLEAADWRDYKQIRLSALQDSPDAFGSTYERSARIPDSDWQARVGSLDARFDLPLVACLGNRFVGLAWGRIEPEAPQHAHLYQMWVDPAVRGRGIGQQLVEQVIGWARQAGCKTMVLQVTEGDRPARRLYERLGFIATGALVPLREGSALMEQTMELSLIPG
ncbi:MAG: GNAT family N-acetyltransferase [Pseudomonadota bacterium]